MPKKKNSCVFTAMSPTSDLTSTIYLY